MSRAKPFAKPTNVSLDLDDPQDFWTQQFAIGHRARARNFELVENSQDRRFRLTWQSPPMAPALQVSFRDIKAFDAATANDLRYDTPIVNLRLGGHRFTLEGQRFGVDYLNGKTSVGLSFTDLQHLWHWMDVRLSDRQTQALENNTAPAASPLRPGPRL